jgi:plastocyanin
VGSPSGGENRTDQDVDAGEKAEVTVTIPQSGKLAFYCKYHKQLGMAGALGAS